MIGKKLANAKIDVWLVLMLITVMAFADTLIERYGFTPILYRYFSKVVVDLSIATVVFTLVVYLLFVKFHERRR